MEKGVSSYLFLGAQLSDIFKMNVVNLRILVSATGFKPASDFSQFTIKPEAGGKPVAGIATLKLTTFSFKISDN